MISMNSVCQCSEAQGSRTIMRHKKHLPDNELCSLHRAVAPDLGIIAIVTDDHADLHPLRTFANNCSKVTGSPTFNF